MNSRQENDHGKNYKILPKSVQKENTYWGQQLIPNKYTNTK